MRKHTKIIVRIISLLLAIPILVLAFMVFVIGPVDTSRANSVQFTGVISAIEEGSSYDIIFHFEDHPDRYYINRGLERGLTLQDLKNQLVGKEVILWHAKSWPGMGGHMTRLMHNDKVLFNEWEETAQK